MTRVDTSHLYPVRARVHTHIYTHTLCPVSALSFWRTAEIKVPTASSFHQPFQCSAGDKQQHSVLQIHTQSARTYTHTHTGSLSDKRDLRCNVHREMLFSLPGAGKINVLSKALAFFVLGKLKQKYYIGL